MSRTPADRGIENPGPRGFALLLDVHDVTLASKLLRGKRNTELDVIEPALLRRTARHLRAAAYNLRTAARRFEVRADRVEAARARALEETA